MIQKQFAERVVDMLKDDAQVIGIAAAGSWITNELDEFSDLDLIVVTKEKITDDKANMIAYAKQFGNYLSGFTGEHVGEPRVLICLYDNPLLHVDIKFVTLEEFRNRVENPCILLDKKGTLKQVMEATKPIFPYTDFQWIEDRFWIWVHYTLLKIGRGELMEAMDTLGFLRSAVFGPLLHIKNKNLPRGVRKVEILLQKHDFDSLHSIVPEYSSISLLSSLHVGVELYKRLRRNLFPVQINLQKETEQKVMEYFDKIRLRVSESPINHC